MVQIACVSDEIFRPVAYLCSLSFNLPINHKPRFRSQGNSLDSTGRFRNHTCMKPFRFATGLVAWPLLATFVLAGVLPVRACCGADCCLAKRSDFAKCSEQADQPGQESQPPQAQGRLACPHCASGKAQAADTSPRGAHAEGQVSHEDSCECCPQDGCSCLAKSSRQEAPRPARVVLPDFAGLVATGFAIHFAEPRPPFSALCGDAAVWVLPSISRCAFFCTWQI